MPFVEHIDDNLVGLFCGPEIHVLLCSSMTQEAAAAEVTSTEFERRKKSLACDACAVWKWVCRIACSSHNMTVEDVIESLSNLAVPLWVPIQNLINWLQVFA